jgi:predicted RNA binding protein YcfA (HicA-like mRNA interferase family)
LGQAKASIILTVKIREIIKLLEQDGWYLARTKGSHRQFKHPVKAGPLRLQAKKALTCRAAL